MNERKVLTPREKALRDIAGLKESITLAFRDLATLELSADDRLAVQKGVDDLSSHLADESKNLARGHYG